MGTISAVYTDRFRFRTARFISSRCSLLYRTARHRVVEHYRVIVSDISGSHVVLVVMQRIVQVPRRWGNNPKRRIRAVEAVDQKVLERLIREAPYAGSGLHKRYAEDYGFQPPVSPRATKSLCDYSKHVPRAVARRLFIAGLERAMVSEHWIGDLPKYVWAVSPEDHVYEAKLGGTNSAEYHGYELYGQEELMKQYVLREWKARCLSP